MERIGPERVFDVGDEEFLVLLLVVQAEHDALARGLGDIAGGKVFHRRIHMMPVGENFFGGGAREGGAQLFLGLGGYGVVVAVEEPEEIGMEGAVGGDEFARG